MSTFHPPDKFGTRPDPLTEAILVIDPDGKDFTASLIGIIKTTLKDGEAKAKTASGNLTDQTIASLKGAIRNRNAGVIKAILCGILRSMPTRPEDTDLDSSGSIMLLMRNHVSDIGL